MSKITPNTTTARIIPPLTIFQLLRLIFAPRLLRNIGPMEAIGILAIRKVSDEYTIGERRDRGQKLRDDFWKVAHVQELRRRGYGID